MPKKEGEKEFNASDYAKNLDRSKVKLIKTYEELYLSLLKNNGHEDLPEIKFIDQYYGKDF